MEVSPLAIRLLGAFEVQVGGQPMRRVRTRSVEWLLALLVLRHGRGRGGPTEWGGRAPGQGGWTERAWLAGTLWPESDAAPGLHNLRRDLLELRQALGAEAIRLRSPNRAILGLDLTGADVDVVRFDAAIAAGDEGSLQAAVALYRGPLLEGCVEEWLLPERASRDEACLQALEALANRAAERGETAAALGYLGHAAALDPLRDSIQRRRMEQLATTGDVPAALLTYREHRLRLHRELNVEPDPETTRLFQALRSGVRRTTLFRPPPPARTPGCGSRVADGGLSGEDGLTASGEPGFVADPQSGIGNPHSPAPLPRPLTALIGREQEAREVVQRVRASRLVTLVGGGGVGKTRLAIEAAEALAAEFPERVAFVELASLADAALLPRHVAAVLGLREADAAARTGPETLLQALCGWITRHPVLLVLDNCEHLVQAAAALAHALLAACPELRILATSRQRLGLPGEVVWRVPSLPAPDPDRLPTDERSAVAAVLSYPAVQLFAERAAAARSEFRLASREDAVAVARICQRLDGIPLALELAAARVALLTPVQIAARLDDRFRLLTGGSRVALPRQQTLLALIDWSYQLLTVPEQALLRRLSVFAGGWPLEAAEAVCGKAVDSGQWIVDSSGNGNDADQHAPVGGGLTTIHYPLTADVLDLLGALEEKSLVLVELREEAIRYRMLETVREFAGEKLETSGERAAIRDRQRDWILQLAEQVVTEAPNPGRTASLTRLEAELDNLRAALAWCQEEAEANPDSDGAEAGLRLADALYWLWMRFGHPMDDPAALENALVRDSGAPASLRARALLHAAYLARSRDRWESAVPYLQSARQSHEEALALARTEEDRRGVAGAILGLARVTYEMGDLQAAWSYGQEARQRMVELGDRIGLVRSVEVLRHIAAAREDHQGARSLLEEHLALAREVGEAGLLIHVLGSMGHLLRDEGDYVRARALYAESLVLRRELGDRIALAQSLEDLAVLAAREQQFERAALLLGAAEAFCETLGARPPVAIIPEYERTVAEGRAALGEAAFAAAWAEGRAMSLEQAERYALGDA